MRNTDISVEAFNVGGPVLRRQISQTIGLFFECAYAGVPKLARLQPLVGTHTHTGRLEVNILMPRAVLTNDGKIRAYNPHPLGKISRELWDNFRNCANHRFGWADPLDYSHSRLTAQPNWLLKQRREGARHGQKLPTELRQNIAAFAECLVDWENISDRDTLIIRMQPELADQDIIKRSRRADSVTFTDIGTGQIYRTRGLLFSDTFCPDKPSQTLGVTPLRRLLMARPPHCISRRASCCC